MAEKRLVFLITLLLIFLSLNFYKSTKQTTMVTAALETVNAIAAAMDQLASSKGYAGITAPMLENVLGTPNLNTVWNGAVLINGPPTVTRYSIILNNTPAIVCKVLRIKIPYNNKYTILQPAANVECPAPIGDFIYNYDANNYI